MEIGRASKKRTLEQLASIESGSTNYHHASDGECMVTGCLGQGCRYWLPGGECAMKLAGEGPMTFAEIGDLLGTSKQYIEAVERRALMKLKKAMTRMIGPRAFEELSLGDSISPMSSKRGERGAP